MIQVSDLHRRAQACLAETRHNPNKLILLHTAIALGSSFLLTLLNYLFSLLIADTGGLGGLGTRSVLTTVQMVFELAVNISLPIWQAGLFYVALRWSDRESADFSHLLHGFRRFGSVLGALLLRGGVFLALSIPASYVSSAIFALTPFSGPVLEMLAPIMEQPEQMDSLLTDAFTHSFMEAAIPLFIIFAIVYILVAIPLFYRLRFSDFAVMEGLTSGKTLLKSLFITKGHFRQLLRLDLSFWWFYLLQLLSVVLCFGDSLLSAAGVSLPVSSTVATFVFLAIGSVCQGILLWKCEAKRVTAYALAYRALAGAVNANTAEKTV